MIEIIVIKSHRYTSVKCIILIHFRPMFSVNPESRKPMTNVFRGYRKEVMARNGFKKLISPGRQASNLGINSLGSCAEYCAILIKSFEMSPAPPQTSKVESFVTTDNGYFRCLRDSWLYPYKFLLLASAHLAEYSAHQSLFLLVTLNR